MVSVLGFPQSFPVLSNKKLKHSFFFSQESFLCEKARSSRTNPPPGLGSTLLFLKATLLMLVSESVFFSRVLVFLREKQSEKSGPPRCYAYMLVEGRTMRDCFSFSHTKKDQHSREKSLVRNLIAFSSLPSPLPPGREQPR